MNSAGFTETRTTDFNLRVDGRMHGTVSGAAGLQLSGKAAGNGDPAQSGGGPFIARF